MNEHTPRHTAPVQGSSDRSFGLVFTIFFVIIGLQPLLNEHSIRLWPLDLSGVRLWIPDLSSARLWAIELSAVILLLTLTVPGVLAPANRAWTKFGLLLHGIVSPIALGILFFGVVTPIGLIMRLLGKDPLRLHFDPSATSYWIVRTPPGPDADSLKNQF